MRHNILSIITAALLLAVTPTATATSVQEQSFKQANAAYDSGDYQRAAELYNAILADGYDSWQLYYNLGNAYYRLDQMGRAILNYQRALRLAPNKQIVKDNLELARSKTVDNIEELPQMFLVQWAHGIAQIASPRGWRIILLATFFLFLTALAIFFIAKEYRPRRTAFVVAAALLLLTFFSAFFAAFSAKTVTNSTKAVVIDPMVVVKGSPDAKSVDKFIIHEGTLLTINEQQDQWWQITIADGKSGWIDSGAERI